LKLKYDVLLSSSAFNFNFSRYTVGSDDVGVLQAAAGCLRAFLRSGGEASLAWGVGQGLTLVPVSAQSELTLPLSAQIKLNVSPI
jgi:hypothetical protein